MELNKAVIGILTLSLVTLGGLSVMGLIQSTERVGTSGIIIRSDPPPPPAPPPSPPPPEPVIEIDVYGDSEYTVPLSEILWGTIEAGEQVNKTLYVKNNGDAGVTLSLSTENWSPADSPDYMSLTWDYDGGVIEPDEGLGLVLILDTSVDCPAYEDFSFDVVFMGS
jgi:hypothetical protein